MWTLFKKASRTKVETRPQPAPREQSRALQLRCIDPGPHAQQLIDPFVKELAEFNCVVERVFTVGEEHFDELVLPPIVTVYIERSVLADKTFALRELAYALDRLVERFRAVGLTGYTSASGDVKATGELGVFVQQGPGRRLRYYINTGRFEDKAFLLIPQTCEQAMASVESPGSLSEVVVWREGGWWMSDRESGQWAPLA